MHLFGFDQIKASEPLGQFDAISLLQEPLGAYWQALRRRQPWSGPAGTTVSMPGEPAGLPWLAPDSFVWNQCQRPAPQIVFRVNNRQALKQAIDWCSAPRDWRCLHCQSTGSWRELFVWLITEVPFFWTTCGNCKIFSHWKLLRSQSYYFFAER